MLTSISAAAKLTIIIPTYVSVVKTIFRSSKVLWFVENFRPGHEPNPPLSGGKIMTKWLFINFRKVSCRIFYPRATWEMASSKEEKSNYILLRLPRIPYTWTARKRRPKAGFRVYRNQKNKLQGVTYIICASFFQSAVRKWKWVFTNFYASEILTPPCISGYISAIYLYISLPALGYNNDRAV